MREPLCDTLFFYFVLCFFYRVKYLSLLDKKKISKVPNMLQRFTILIVKIDQTQKMKTQELNSTSFSNSISQTPAYESIFDSHNHPQKPLCPSNHQARFICLNPKCKASSSKAEKQFDEKLGNEQRLSPKSCVFVCSNNECKSCFYEAEGNSCGEYKKSGKIIGVHSKCFVGDYQSLISCIQQQKKQSQPLNKAITSIIDNFIDYLSDLRQTYLTQLQYYGLTQIQRHFLSCFQHHKYDELTSTMCFQIVKELDYQPAVNGFMAQKKLSEYWQKTETKVKKMFEYFDKIIGKEYGDRGMWVEIESRVISDEKEKLNLVEMLQTQQGRPVESLTLLYRASQHQFNTDIFHQKCDRHPHTLTLLQTQFGNKIGGYTPLIWDKTGNNRTDKDPTNKTFIFSLTHNHKFLLKPNHQAAILQYSSAGPTFGCGPSDIYIKNRANTVNIYGNVGNSFIHEEYVFGEQRAWTKFSGATNGKEFRAREWEVFEVKWSEKI